MSQAIPFLPPSIPLPPYKTSHKTKKDGDDISPTIRPSPSRSRTRTRGGPSFAIDTLGLFPCRPRWRPVPTPGDRYAPSDRFLPRGATAEGTLRLAPGRPPPSVPWESPPMMTRVPPLFLFVFLSCCCSSLLTWVLGRFCFMTARSVILGDANIVPYFKTMKTCG